MFMRRLLEARRILAVRCTQRADIREKTANLLIWFLKHETGGGEDGIYEASPRAYWRTVLVWTIGSCALWLIFFGAGSETATRGAAAGGRKRGRGDVEHDSDEGSTGAHSGDGRNSSGGDEGDGHDNGDDRAAAAPPRKKKRRAKGRKTHSQRDAERRAAGYPMWATSQYARYWMYRASQANLHGLGRRRPAQPGGVDDDLMSSCVRCSPHVLVLTPSHYLPT